MFLYKIKMRFLFFWQYHGKKIVWAVVVPVFIFPVLLYFLIIEAPIIPHRIQVHRFNNMSRARMIYDFEYLMTVLEENWPFFNLAISANGVDMHALADEMRAMLHDPSTEINCPLDFVDLLNYYFFAPVNQLGHLSFIKDYRFFFDIRGSAINTVEWDSIHGIVTNPFNAYRYEMYTRPEAVMFYSRLRDAGRGQRRRQHIGPVMEFDILYEGQAGYMRINRMIGIRDDEPVPSMRGMHEMFYYERLFYYFLKEIEDFEHLIIDLRGNTGGQTTHFDALIMSQLINERIHLPGYVFFMDGSYTMARKYINDYIMRGNFLTALDYRIYTMNYAWQAVYFTEPLPYLDTTIQLPHVYYINYVINVAQPYTGMRRRPGATRSPLFARINFGGKLWLLTDERTASAAEGVTAILKYSGAATVVGEPTWGIMGVFNQPVVTTASLPNTGVIFRFDIAYFTDIYGRPLQGYGIQPHYPNRPGMDALETVLAMIAEGNY